jgi:protein-S-isoprenylcysteine O-methyltransferase Ste14
VPIEDRLLASRFGDQYLDYQRTIPVYVPRLKPSKPKDFGKS